MIGYHGTSKAVAEKLLRGEPFKPSTNPGDWLGHGIYLFTDPSMALWWAKQWFSEDACVLSCKIDTTGQLSVNDCFMNEFYHCATKHAEKHSDTDSQRLGNCAAFNEMKQKHPGITSLRAHFSNDTNCPYIGVKGVQSHEQVCVNKPQNILYIKRYVAPTSN